MCQWDVWVMNPVPRELLPAAHGEIRADTGSPRRESHPGALGDASWLCPGRAGPGVEPGAASPHGIFHLGLPSDPQAAPTPDQREREQIPEGEAAVYPELLMCRVRRWRCERGWSHLWRCLGAFRWARAPLAAPHSPTFPSPAIANTSLALQMLQADLSTPQNPDFPAPRATRAPTPRARPGPSLGAKLTEPGEQMSWGKPGKEGLRLFPA